MLDAEWIEQAGPLERVRARVVPGDAFELVELVLRGGTIRLSADPDPDTDTDTDELNVATIGGDAALPDLSAHPARPSWARSSNTPGR